MLAVGVLLLSLLGITSTANAQTPTLTAAAQALVDNGTVTQLVEQGGTGKLASGWPAPNQVASELWLSEHRSMPNQVSSKALHKELTKLRWKAGVTKGASILGRINLGATAFMGGWMIGSEIRNQLMKVAVPQTPLVGGNAGWGNGSPLQSYTLVGVEKDQVVDGAVMPDDGFYVEYKRADGFVGKNAGRYTECYGSPAYGSIFVPGAKPIGGPGAGTCTTAEGFSQPVVVAFVPSDVLVDRDPVNDDADGLDRAPVKWYTPDNGTKPHATVDSKVKAQLVNCADYPTFCKWLNAQADATVPDPTMITMPTPLALETFPDYVARLRAQGHLGTITLVEVDPSEAVEAKGPRTVLDTSPKPGTRVADPYTPVEVFVNPRTFTSPNPNPTPTPSGTPDPNATPTPDGSGDPGPGGSGWEPPDVPELNLEPLRQAIPCGSFPFGVPCWTLAALSSWVTEPVAPTFCMPFPFADPDPCVDMSIWDDAMPILRAALLIFTTILLAWQFMRAALGFGGGGGDDD